jgi:hypothetical protein
MSGRFTPGFSGPFLSFVFLGLSLLPVSVAAAEVTTPAATPDREQVIVNYLNERLAIWQQRLSLQDWKISIIMSHPSDLKPKTLGNIHWDSDTKSAVIRVLDASDYRLPYKDMVDDMEFTVVHELIHLELSSLPRSEASRRDEEHAVNQIASALLKLDRVNRK